MAIGHPDVPESAEQHIRSAVEEVLQESSAFLIDLRMRGKEGAYVIDAFVDGDQALDIATLSGINRGIVATLDADPAWEGRYTLNVSSPGADRPLVMPRQYNKHIGRDLEVTYKPGNADEQELVIKGKLTLVDDDGIELDLGKKKGTVRVLFAEIGKAQVKLPW